MTEMPLGLFSAWTSSFQMLFYSRWRHFHSYSVVWLPHHARSTIGNHLGVLLGVLVHGIVGRIYMF